MTVYAMNGDETDVRAVDNMFVNFDSMETFERWNAIAEKEETAVCVLLENEVYKCGTITKEVIDTMFDDVMGNGDVVWDVFTEYCYCKDMADTYGHWGNV